MLCEQCKQNQATIHFTQVINGERTEMNLCAECAHAQGAFSLQDVSSLLSGLLEGMPSRAAQDEGLRCSRCGLSYRQFSQSGVLGCAQCYRDFRKQLSPVLQRIHGRLQHEGHIPAGMGESLQIKRQIDQKRGEMQSAIEQENFERAAALRDELRTLQEQLTPNTAIGKEGDSHV